MIKRYQFPLINELWSEESRAEVWKNIEILVAQAWHKEGLISQSEIEVIQKVHLNIADWKNRESKLNHEMAAFVDMLSAQCGKAGRWIHYGLTSNDVLDTSLNYLLNKTSTIILQLLNDLKSEVQKKALEEKNTLMIGRTHGQYAEPITLGYKFALWYDELSRHEIALRKSQELIRVVKIAGPTGIHCDLPLSITEFVAQKLQMKVDYAVNQLMSRDRLIALINSWNNLSTTLEKIALEIRNLQRSEISELQENFTRGQKGSSAMPHKKNPRLSENICGLARLFRSMSQAIFSTNLLWHERDLTNSSIERFTLPELSNLLGFMLSRLTKIIMSLKINYQQIKLHLKEGEIAVFSHRVLLYLIRHREMTRNEAYKIVQRNAQKAIAQKKDFRKLMQKEKELTWMKSKDWKNIWNWESFLQNIDQLYQHIFKDFRKNK